MKILYDGQIYADQITGGIGRYFTNIINRLPEADQPTLTTSYRRNKSSYPTHPNLQIQEFPNFRPHQIAHKLRGHYFRWRNDRQSFDIFHPTYYYLLSQTAFNRSRRPLVITVYDMIHELFADKMTPDGTIANKQAAILAADAIICISESTKNDLLRYFPAVAPKIVVTYLASEFKQEWADGDEKTPAQPYFLYVGSRAKAYKNFDTLLLAFAKVVSVNPDVRLCVVGAPFNEAEQRQIAELYLTERIQHYQYASDTHLAKLYRCSVAFVYPSLYEGFGIPPLEAMACGTVVVAANSSSIPEVVGDAGILFDPKAVGDLADILLELLAAPSKRDLLIAKGFDRHQQFSWDKTAEQTVAVYRSL
ncbi:glycosyltransferase family 1 protein [Chamaesiphon sp. OTE_75_metabat_556]|uniref:glycosyltransferase family 4 protein n=1 Tax=Chamaesiphon sp. OTE_75_metabat_556 TaxID=2964692 RepID=UPI00286C6F7D|nr:glycosyltransferase family 1 protein [Chamaesiphon sp. OTE_75_metabat_556]